MDQSKFVNALAQNLVITYLADRIHLNCPSHCPYHVSESCNFNKEKISTESLEHFEIAKIYALLLGL